MTSNQVLVLNVGDKYRGKTIRDAVRLSTGQYLIKTDDSKSARDFRVKLVLRLSPTRKSITPKHAHFAIDLYGKLNANLEGARSFFNAIVEVWHGRDPSEALVKYQNTVAMLRSEERRVGKECRSRWS